MMSLHIHQVLPKPRSPVLLPPISSLIGPVDALSKDTNGPSSLQAHDTLLIQQGTGHMFPLMIPHDNVSAYPSSNTSTSTTSTTGIFDSQQSSHSEISRTNSASSIQSQSPLFETHSTLSSLASISAIHAQLQMTNSNPNPSLSGSTSLQLHNTVPPPPTTTTTNNTYTHEPRTSTSTDHTTTTISDKKYRKYRCKTCEKSFTTSGHLARHSRIHTGERKHQCPHPGCDARFARQDNCMQHYRTHKSVKSARSRSTVKK